MFRFFATGMKITNYLITGLTINMKHQTIMIDRWSPANILSCLPKTIKSYNYTYLTWAMQRKMKCCPLSEKPLTILKQKWITESYQILSKTPFHPIFPEGVNCSLQVAGAGCRLQVANCRLQVQVAGCRLQAAGCDYIYFFKQKMYDLYMVRFYLNFFNKIRIVSFVQKPW